jgi:hypothetical protein
MPHQNTQSPRATAQNAATTNQTPGNDRGVEQNGSVHPEPRSYAAADVPDSTGEMADYADDGDALGLDDVQQGGSHSRRPVATEARSGQGPKTLRANRKMTKSGSPDQGTF